MECFIIGYIIALPLLGMVIKKKVRSTTPLTTKTKYSILGAIVAVFLVGIGFVADAIALDDLFALAVLTALSFPIISGLLFKKQAWSPYVGIALGGMLVPFLCYAFGYGVVEADKWRTARTYSAGVFTYPLPPASEVLSRQTTYSFTQGQDHSCYLHIIQHMRTRLSEAEMRRYYKDLRVQEELIPLAKDTAKPVTLIVDKRSPEGELIVTVQARIHTWDNCVFFG